MKKNFFYILIFILSLYITYHLCTQNNYHRYDNFYNIKYWKLFFLQALLLFSADKALFVNIRSKILSLLINSCIVFVCCILTFQSELFRAMSWDVPTGLFLETMFDPYIFRLHFVYAVILFVCALIYIKLSQICIKWWNHGV